MEKTNKKTLEEIIRVDHAGERGAIKIYEGQLLALKTFKQNASLKRKIEEMKEHEREHYEYFDNEIKNRSRGSEVGDFIGDLSCSNKRDLRRDRTCSNRRDLACWNRRDLF